MCLGLLDLACLAVGGTLRGAAEDLDRVLHAALNVNFFFLNCQMWIKRKKNL